MPPVACPKTHYKTYLDKDTACSKILKREKEPFFDNYAFALWSS